jgi:5-methylcytosine-specific restriction protein A
MPTRSPAKTPEIDDPLRTGRTVPEWIGKTPDSAIPDRVRLRVLMRYRCVCAKCGIKLGGGVAWDCDHTQALVNEGENRESNLQPLCKKNCHPKKTVDDVAAKSETYQARIRHYGIKKPKRPMPGSKASGFKRKMDGTVVKR